jgi:hypothetical protein
MSIGSPPFVFVQLERKIKKRAVQSTRRLQQPKKPPKLTVLSDFSFGRSMPVAQVSQ